MNVLRRVASIVLIGFAVAALYRAVWLPYQCNRLRKALRVEMQAVFEISSRAESARAKVVARNDAAVAMICAERCPTNPDFLMIAASGHLVTARPDAAAELYRRALRLDRRPELYLALGTALLQMGERDEAAAAFATAGTFAPYTIDMIMDPSIRSAVRNSVQERDRRLREGAAVGGKAER